MRMKINYVRLTYFRDAHEDQLQVVLHHEIEGLSLSQAGDS